jgi:hypothetical protein
VPSWLISAVIQEYPICKQAAPHKCDCSPDQGARWYSMEMAGVVTYTGAKIIQVLTKSCTDMDKGKCVGRKKYENMQTS